MTDKQIIIDGVDMSNFCLVCYYDNKTNELVRIEQYNDNDSSMYSDIESYKYGYNAEITKPEKIIKQLKRKEQECEELKEILKDEKDKYNKLAVNYDAYVSMANEQLDKLKAENETLFKAIEEVNKINKRLEAENKELKKYKEVVDKLAGMQVILTNEEKMPMLYENAKDLKLKQLSKALDEIKELLLKTPTNSKEHCVNAKSVILQKISEVIDDKNS